MKTKVIKLLYIIFIIIIMFFILETNSISAQKTEDPTIIDVHQHEYTMETILPTCETDGYDLYTCICGDMYTENITHATGHIYSEWVITTNPTADINGEETQICQLCKKTEVREYICPHEETTESVYDATCTKKGHIDHHCNFCKKLINTEILEIKPHDYSKWKTTIYATPTQNGEQYRVCSCGKTEYRTTTFKPAGDTAIYIEGTGINHKMAITAFSQAAVDSNDICYTSSRLNSINPIVLGHNTGTLKLLSKTKVGSLIYLWINGEESVYKVTVSEKARDLKKDIEGVSGEKLLTKYDTPHLHLYTCYKESTGQFERWLVLAEKIS